MSSRSVGTLEKGLTVLEAVEKAQHPVSIQEVAELTGIQRLAVYRLLSTLEQHGYVRRGQDKRYRATSRRRRILLGYSAPLTGNTFRLDIASSLEEAANAASVDLMALDNGESDEVRVMQNADAMIEARVDLALFFQPVERLGHMLADRLSSRGVPFITIERPIHGGVYFGANNYQAGKLAGKALGAYALEKWRGRFDHVVLLEGAQTSTNVQARLAGVLVGLREFAGDVDESQIVHLEGRAHQDASREAMQQLLRTVKRGVRLLVSGFNDLSAIGALQAVKAAKREQDVVIVGHNAMHEGRAEIRKSGPFIASVAYFPERYGAKLVKLALAMIEGEQVAPAVYTDHVVIDRTNVDKLYPPGGAKPKSVSAR